MNRIKVEGSGFKTKRFQFFLLAWRKILLVGMRRYMQGASVGLIWECDIREGGSKVQRREGYTKLKTQMEGGETEEKQQIPKCFSRCKEWPFLGSLYADMKPSPLLLSGSQEQISGTQSEKPEKPEVSWPRELFFIPFHF